MKTISPMISNAIVIGDNRKFLTCLITVKSDQDGNLSPEIINQLKQLNSNSQTTYGLIKDKVVKKYFQTVIDRVNIESKFHMHKIRKLKIIPNDFTIESGELTDNYKLKRKKISSNYSKEIEKMYLKANF